MAALQLGKITILQSSNGLYSLKDLWKSHGNKSKRPKEWLRNKATQEYISFLQSEIPPSLFNQEVIEVLHGNNGDTFVCRELVFSYAMWVSPKFHHLVIKTFDALTSATTRQELIATKHRLDNALQGDIFDKYRLPRDSHCLQVIMKCSPFQAKQYHDELVGKDILDYRDVPQPPRRIYCARREHPAIIGKHGETVLFSDEVKKLFPEQSDWVGEVV